MILVYNASGTLTDRFLNGPGANSALADENASGTVSWLLADNEGTSHGTMLGSNRMELCYLHVSSNGRIASCVELTKQQ